MRRLSAKNTDTVPSIEYIESPAAVSIASTEIRKFLKRIITGKDTDLIISTVRKGSWIIDDILRTCRLNLKHYTNQNIKDVSLSDLEGKSILIFDDSVKTGESILTILSEMTGYRHVRAACIMINDDALKTFRERGIDVDYLERFKEYASYNNDNGELAQGCQAYYYAYFMIPYISTLSVNYSPDYKSLSLIIKGGSTKDLKNMTDLVAKTIMEDRGGDIHEVDSTLYTRRISFNIDVKYLEGRLLDLNVPYESDLSKIRVSASIYKDFSEIVVTPMFCPICDDVKGLDMKSLPFLLSEGFISDYCKKTVACLTKNGFDIIRKRVMTGTSGDNGAM